VKSGPDISTIYRIARCYYLDGLSQEEIALNEGFSRSQISRILDKAQKLGLVKISVVPPSSEKTEELSSRIVDMFNLQSALVVPVKHNADDEEISKSIATCAADFIAKVLDGYSIVGVGWGRTMYLAAQMLPRTIHLYRKPLFVPLIGISGDKNPNLQINTIVDRFCAAFKSQGLFINIPSVREKGVPLSKIEEQRVASLRKYWGMMEVAIFGLGTAPSHTRNLIDEFPQKYKEELMNSTACGDILAQFFEEEGKVFHSRDEYDLLAYDITKLPMIKRRICLAGGEMKAVPILAALQAQYISDLVTDEKTAEAILNLAVQKTTKTYQIKKASEAQLS